MKRLSTINKQKASSKKEGDGMDSEVESSVESDSEVESESATSDSTSSIVSKSEIEEYFDEDVK